MYQLSVNSVRLRKKLETQTLKQRGRNLKASPSGYMHGARVDNGSVGVTRVYIGQNADLDTYGELVDNGSVSATRVHIGQNADLDIYGERVDVASARKRAGPSTRKIALPPTQDLSRDVSRRHQTLDRFRRPSLRPPCQLYHLACATA